ncbi:PolA DNA polymerase I - 3'-5' exonuclease and polymerase domains [actinobacterium SCGC AAA044-D11]
MSATKKLLLIDGHSLAYRAFYALPAENFATSTGQHTNAIYGFASMLINLISSEKPTHIATAFDVSRKTFRSERFPEYKANRSATPDEFRSQTSFLFDLVHGFGIRHFAVEGFEADDIIATLAKRAEVDGFEVLICTGDRDSFQLINSKTTVLYPKRGVTDLARMTPEAVLEKYGLTPAQYPDFAALRGDPSDNLPSIPGVGEKTAAKWIAEYGSLEKLLSNIEKVGGKVGDSLRANIASVQLNAELTHLRSDMSIETSISELLWDGIKSAELFALLDNLEIKALKDRVKNLGSSVSDEPVTKVATKASKVISKEITADALSDLLLNHTKPIAIECSAPEGKILEYAIALDEVTLYLVRDSKVGKWWNDVKLPKYLHGAKELIRNYPIEGLTFDTELAAYLINPGGRNLSLPDLTERFLGLVNAEQEESLFSQFDGLGAVSILQLVPILSNELASREMSALMNDLEIPVLIELADMERTGIGVDTSKLRGLSAFFRGEVERETSGAHKEAGKEFNVGSPKQLQAILFDDLGLPKTKKIKTGFTTDAESLDWLFAKTKHPILKHLLRIRETSKLLTTVDGLIDATASDGRIHTIFQQTVTATGRLSSTNPNLQNIPVRTEEGRKIRDCFISKDPYITLLTADYSQIEMRIMAHLSKDANLIEAFKMGEDLHSTVAGLVFGVKPDGVDPEMRRQIKAMSYGLAYGLSAYGLAQQLDLSPTDAAILMDKYFARFGGIRDYLAQVVVIARDKGYTETIMGRRRYLPDLTSDNRPRREVAERMALNAPIQGSAADIIKVAMLNVGKALVANDLKSRLLLQVHDELILEVAKGESEILSELVKKEMGSAFELSVPLDVNIGIGTSWDLAAH